MCTTLRNWTTFGIGGDARRLIVANDLATLIDNAPYSLVLGRGSNVLVSDDGYDGTVLVNRYSEIARRGNVVTVGSGTGMGTLCSYLESEGLSGMEWAVGIPASVGGAVRMNAGAAGSCIADRLIFADVLADGAIRRFSDDELGFSYRHSAIEDGMTVVRAAFELVPAAPDEVKRRGAEIAAARKLRIPAGRSAGSVFKNPEGVAIAKLIDDAGLKGLRRGGAVISHRHANIIINDGGATARDVCDIIRTVKAELLARYGVSAREEIVFIGEMT